MPDKLEGTEDEVEAKRSELRKQLVERCRRSAGSRALLTVRWGVV